MSGRSTLVRIFASCSRRFSRIRFSAKSGVLQWTIAALRTAGQDVRTGLPHQGRFHTAELNRQRQFLEREPLAISAVLHILLRVIEALERRSSDDSSQARLKAVSFIHRFGGLPQPARPLPLLRYRRGLRAKPQRDGTTALTLTPLELIDRLAAQPIHRLAPAQAPPPSRRARAKRTAAGGCHRLRARGGGRNRLTDRSQFAAPGAGLQYRSPARSLWAMLPWWDQAAAVRVAAAGLSQPRRG